MKRNVLLLVLAIVLTLSVLSCGTNSKITNPVTADTIGAAIGTPETFDLVTWNIENFPLHNPETTNLLKTLIPNLKVDCIAVDEIASTSSLASLMSQIPDWSYLIASSGMVTQE